MSSPAWQKSTYSGSSNACVEVRAAGELIELRESADGDAILRTTPASFAALLQGIKANEFNHHTA